MKKVLILGILLVAGMAGADTYYCVPKDGGLFCKPVDFEHRVFDFTPQEQTWRQVPNPNERSFRCYGKGETYKCLPFDNGAILLETPHSCPTTPSISPWSWTNSVDVGVFGGMGR